MVQLRDDLPAHLAVFTDHPRIWRDFRYVYPVVSRRSRGLSIGINLNPNKACNYDCPYCSVDRNIPATIMNVDLNLLAAELNTMIRMVVGGELWRDERFVATPTELRHINDIAFSGDGEPTTFARFDRACAIAAQIKAAHHLTNVKLVLITNATGLHRQAAQRGLAVLDANDGQVWAKLDAGTQEYYRQVNGGRQNLDHLLANIATCARQRAIVIQTMLLCMHGLPMSDAEFTAYIDHLRKFLANGCHLMRIQLYTIARPPAQHWATPLPQPQLEFRAAQLRDALPTVPVEVFGGIGD